MYQPAQSDDIFLKVGTPSRGDMQAHHLAKIRMQSCWTHLIIYAFSINLGLQLKKLICLIQILCQAATNSKDIYLDYEYLIFILTK